MGKLAKILTAATAALFLVACSDIMSDLKTRSSTGTSQDWLATPLTLEAAVAGAVVTFCNTAQGPVTYKVNRGTSQTISSEESANITLAAIGDKVEFFGDNKAYALCDNGYSYIACSADCYIYGNIMSLVKSDGFKDATELEQTWTFAHFFHNNSHIKNKDAAYFLLPATTLKNCCYRGMFNGCSSLTVAPALPATTLTDYCYETMFSGCASLCAAPALPATTLANNCYGYMFSGCSKLTSVTCLATDISASNCTTNWLDGVAASGTFIKAAGATWTEGISGIPSGWTVVEK